MGQRRRGRECALQMLYRIDMTGSSAEQVFRDFWAGQPAEEEVQRFAERLVCGVLEARDRLDGIVAESAQHWRLERMAVVDRNVLRMAVYEILLEADTPVIVAIDEAIEVAKRFGGPESGRFINGILDDVRCRAERGELG